jgi:hypothetical protein
MTNSGSPPFPWNSGFVEAGSRNGAKTQRLEIFGGLPLCDCASLRENSVKSTQLAESPNSETRIHV